MLHIETIDHNTLAILTSIQNNPLFQNMRLVGGTALALQIGHRKSIDIDLFGPMALEAAEIIEELKAYGDLAIRSTTARIQHVLINGVQVDIVNYEYPWLDNPICSNQIRLASPRDIAAMKLSAITNRGSRKDFVDLTFLLQIFTLDEMLHFYSRKFLHGSRFTVLKSLVYFDDAEDEPMPMMLVPFDWGAAKQTIIAAATACIPR